MIIVTLNRSRKSLPPSVAPSPPTNPCAPVREYVGERVSVYESFFLIFYSSNYEHKPVGCVIATCFPRHVPQVILQSWEN